ncbi:L-rhamnose mutarotase [Glaciimonas sp. PCH181]|uniref:L-rhamnose mutarotase n=1 Tax=Glaciimonas sp. PCH181 TaxID=2133943 RepID=UPI000D390EEC|nr:L-rhamnose mutarotase [Glaciimonas sp. PCH181]PUA17398.1 L-rhamnose mutarotase [Glaciimonas sp. PCH181]
MQKMGMVIGINPESIVEYKALHAAVWPQVLATLQKANIRNYTIFLREPENLLFGCWEYHGNDFDADMAQIGEDAETKRWWRICGPCQQPLASRLEGEHWAMMETVFHMD